MKKFLLTATALAVFAASPANAYYDRTDYPEFVEVQPNQSAFAIPVVGDTKSTQTNFGSQAFLDANKVATKRFQVPHTLIRNPGWSADYYVPAVKLILVDRTPYMREWTDSTTSGTSSKAEGFHFQSREGINISTGISIAAMIKEEDAAKYLYWFGTNNQVVNTNDPSSNFASVAYGKSLKEVCDTVIRGYVQSALSNEFMRNSFVDDNAKAGEIMDKIRADVIKHFAEKGITVDFIGFSGGLDYDKPIQDSINDTFITTQKALASANMMTAVPYMQAQAEINIRNAEAQAITKWNGSIPVPANITTIGQGWIDTLLSYVGFGAKTPEKK
jgi:hypothetical protein